MQFPCPRLMSRNPNGFRAPKLKHAAIAVTLNGSLDYFGQTVNIAARIQNLSDAKRICLASAVLTAPGVKDILLPYAMKHEAALLKGVRRQMPVSRITAMSP